MLRRAPVVAVALLLASAGAASAYLTGTPQTAGAGTATTTPATTTTTTTTTTLTASAALVLNGHGWGHGLGMSQWGAKGFAEHGWTFDRILAYYYRGTTLGPAPVSRVRVLLVEGAKRVVLGSTSDWRATDADGATVDLPAGDLPLTPKLEVQDEELVSPVTFAPRSSPLLVRGKPYRGTLVVSSEKGKLQVVNSLGLEAYLKGVVPSEMPSAWPAEALKAQAVAARSYALVNLAKGRAYDLYGDVRSQVYGGLKAESAPVSAAVDATAKQVVLYGGKIATTYYFSTSGGRTVSAAEVTGKPIPYLVSVLDPYDVESPHHDWGPVVLDAAKVAKQLKVSGSLVDLRTTPGPSGRIREAAAVTPLGETTFAGTKLRSLLGLDSTWFTLGWLSLAPPKTPVTFGGAGALAGAARNVGPVTLEARSAGGLWQALGPVTPDASGAFSTIVRPQLTTDYRLAAGAVRAAQLRVKVAPRVDVTVSAGTATGSIRPVIAGAPVQLQRAEGATWTTVATSTTDAAGSFSVAGDAAPGSYRVRVAPGHGLAPGFSATFTG